MSKSGENMKASRSIEQNMFFGAKPEIFQKATELRNNETEAEKKLWEYLKKFRSSEFKFRRQHPIDIFVVDFYCHNAKLVIELDGGIHKIMEIKEHDQGRAAELENLGLTILRFTNYEIANDFENSVNKIGNYLKKCK